MHTTTKTRLLLCLAAALPGCGTTRPAHFYTLNPLVLQTPAATSAVAVQVGPVGLAQYLDRPQMARRVSAQELDFDEFHRWAEPLEGALARILTQDLGLLLGSEHVLQFPERGLRPWDYRVTVQVARCEQDDSGRAVFEARWTLLRDSPPGESATRLFREERPLAHAGDAGALAAALDASLAELARQIAAQIAGS